MTKRVSFSAMNKAVLVSVFGVLFGFNSVAVRATAVMSNNIEACEPGYYVVFDANGSKCQRCPPGTFSNFWGAESCRPCRNTVYNNEGANAAEFWNGNLYCVFLGNTDDDFLNNNSKDITGHIASGSPTIIQGPAKFRFAASSRMPSFRPSNAPSSKPSESNILSSSSHFPSLVDHDGTPNDDSIKLALMCNDPSSERTGHFEWHGRCKQCPSKHEMILIPFLVFIAITLLILLLEFLVPVCFSTHVWWAVEYLHMLYLIGISTSTWSPAAEFLFGRVLPIFVVEFNHSFSLRCLMDKNWPQHESADQLLTLAVPVIFLIFLTFLSKISSNWMIGEATVSRWTTILLCMGYLKLVLSSLKVLRLPTSWSADDLYTWMNSDSFYGTLGGLFGLLFYGLAFPFWFLQSILRYKTIALALANTDAQEVFSAGRQERHQHDSEEDECEQQNRDSVKKKQAKRKKKIFMTLGVFPITLRPDAWWWPGLWFLRKFLCAVLLSAFPDGQFLVLVMFLFIYLLGIIVQQHYLPLGDEHRKGDIGGKNNWYCIATVDTALQVCVAAMIGVAFISSSSFAAGGISRSPFQTRLEDGLVLFIFFSSLVYLALSIGVCCLYPKPRFMTVASQIVATNNRKNDSRIGKDNSLITSPSDEISMMRTFSSESSSSHDLKEETDFFGISEDGALGRSDTDTSTVDEEHGAGLDLETLGHPSANPSPYLVTDNDGQEERRKKQLRKGKTFVAFRSRPEIFRSNSTIASNDDDGLDIDTEGDAGTVYEEVWVDEDTGEEDSDPKQGNWMDAETGMPAVPLGDSEDCNIDERN